MDYGRPIAFGYFPPPALAAYEEVAASVRLAEDLGYELIGIQDHPYQMAFLDTWTLISALGAMTRLVTLFPDVASLPLRPPAVLAKSAASLDHITGGRIELGLGAGAYWPAIAAMGGAQRTPGEAVSALEEAIQVIRRMWSGERSARFSGRFYSLAGVRPGPPPAHRMGIWIGAYQPRMLAITGRLGDGWVPSGPPYLAPRDVGASAARIDEAAAQAGRDPAEIRRLYNVWGMIDDRGGGGDDRWEWEPSRWIDVLTRLAVEDGIDSFLFGPNHDPQTQLRRWAEEIAPAVRANVDRTRRR